MSKVTILERFCSKINSNLPVLSALIQTQDIINWKFSSKSFDDYCHYITIFQEVNLLQYLLSFHIIGLNQAAYFLTA